VTTDLDRRRGSPSASPIWREQLRAWRRVLNVPRVLEAAWRRPATTTPRSSVLAEGTHALYRYNRSTPAVHREPVLLCYALVNRPSILDLEPDKSVVRQYLARGFEVYLIDWGAPSQDDRTFTLEHYVCGFLKKAVDTIAARHGTPSLHLLGYCMGGTLSTLFAALWPERLKTLTLLAAPIDFSGRSSLLSIWTDPHYFDVDALVDTYGNCPAWFLQSCFLAMNPVRNLLEKTIAFCDQMDDVRNVETFFALERWVNDNIPVAGETFRQFVRSFYQGNALVRGELRLSGARVELSRIQCPLLLLTAEHDHLVAPESTEGLRPHVRAREIESKRISAGHVGLVASKRAHETLWPAVTQWCAERSTAAAAQNPAFVTNGTRAPAGASAAAP